MLPVGPGGHYTGLGSINGHPIHFVVDTGATNVALGADVAAQLGIDTKGSETSSAMTANGAVSSSHVTLKRVTVGDVTIYNVQASVMPGSMPVVLLGNSFLSHFQMHNDSSSMILDKTN